MAWEIKITAEPTAATADAPALTALEVARAGVLRVKHEIADTQHQLDDDAHRESWVRRAANDVLENLLAHLPATSATRIELEARGGIRGIDHLVVTLT